jgi:hypothetical protein
MTMKAWTLVEWAANPTGSRGGLVRVGSGFPATLRSSFAALSLFVCGCNAFNPAFVDLIEPSDGSSLVTLTNPPGHVVVTVLNRTIVDEQLLNYLKPKLGMSDAELRALTPRVRMRLRVTFVDGSFQVIEFVTGSSNLVDPEFNTQAVPDLNQNDRDNAVMLCDVALVELEPGTNVEVFIPVAIEQWELVETNNPAGGVDQEFQLRGEIAPQFRALLVDDTDEDGNVILLRNVGVRDVPSPTPNVICGSVLAVLIDGTLTVPFLSQANTTNPSFDIDDEETEAGIGGRYEFGVSVQ